MAKQLLDKFQRNLPVIYSMAVNSESEEIFAESVNNYASEKLQNAISPEMTESAELLIRMVQYESQSIFELSRGEKLFIETLSILWNFLNEIISGNSNKDMLEDLYHTFCRCEGLEKRAIYPESKFAKQMKRWPSGLDKEIREKRATNKERIITLLINKIDKRTGTSGRYQFQEGMSYEQKTEQVREWWNDFRFHLTMAVKSPGELNLFLEESLSTKSMRMLSRAKKKKMPFFVTPYYLSLMNVSTRGFDDYAIRKYVLYSESLVETYGNIRAWEKEDKVLPGEPNAAGWLLLDGKNIHRRYPDVAIMIPDTRGRSCGGLCASCQRMYDFQSERLNFDFDALKPKESWDRKLVKIMEYFENDSQIRDILITGGDALMSRNKPLEKILDAVLKMAAKKIEANKLRPNGKKYHQMQRVRLGSRLLAYLPMRVDNELIDILRNFRIRGEALGIKQFFIQTHFQSSLEITVEARKAINAILSAGWIISNQLVFTAASSRRGHTAKLRHDLNSLGVVTYYTFSVKGFEENSEVFSPNSRSIQEQKEEKIFGALSEEMRKELQTIFEDSNDRQLRLNSFMKKYDLPFIPTDRNVLNLPAIGKSMTFKMVGLTADGKRILKFGHDNTRRHSPIIDNMGEIYIVEARSIVSYLHEIEKMGEHTSDYSSIWSYTSGKTEPVFSLFNYSEPEFKPTEAITNYKEL